MSFARRLCYLVVVVEVVWCLGNVSWTSVRMRERLTVRMRGRVRGNVLTQLALVVNVVVVPAVAHVAVHVLPVSFRHDGSSVGGQLPQVVFLGQLSPLLVMRLALRVQRVPH